MRTYKLIVLFTAMLVVYTGCGTQKYKYLYQKPETNCYKHKALAPLKENEVVSFSNLLVKIKLKVHSYYISSVLPTANVAYATTIATEYTPLEQITDIEVVTLNNYNLQYPSGTDLSSICKFGYDTIANTKTEFLKKYNDRNEKVNSFSPLSNDLIVLSLSQTPTTYGTKHRFAIKLHTNTGAELADTTQTIIILQ